MDRLPSTWTESISSGLTPVDLDSIHFAWTRSPRPGSLPAGSLARYSPRMRFETLAVHSGRADDPVGAVAPPIHLSTTFARDPEGRPLGGHTYIRESNPTE